MALRPGSEDPELSVPEDYAAHHPNERPEEWGWHGEWGRASRIAGWVVAIVLLVMITATHYNDQGTGWLIGFTAALLLVLAWDVHRRRNAWRR